MKLILILTFFAVIQVSLQSKAKSQDKKTDVSLVTDKISRCIDDSKNPQLKCSKRTPVKADHNMKKARLKANEYTLNYGENKSKTFTTVLYDGLLLSGDCFKDKKPKCQAFAKTTTTLNTKPQENLKSPYHNNLGAIHCELMGGKGLIAKSSSNDESDFCQFEDGSMVSSWSSYYKTHPPVNEAK